MLVSLDKHFLKLPFFYQVVIAIATIVVIGTIAYKKKQLTISGMIAAVILGLSTILLGGFTALSLYLFFLITAALIGKLSKKIRGLDKIHKKGGQRDYMQVIANGLPALLSLICYYFTKNIIFMAVFCASLGEAVSDTWAGEIGVLSKEDPISILTLKRIEKGLSGGVSFLGTLSAFLAAAIYGLFFYSYYDDNLSLALIVIMTSFVGALIDSFLGATVQAHYYDDEQGRLTEHERSRSGKELKLVRGIKLFDNDIVNLTSNIISALFTYFLSQFLF